VSSPDVAAVHGPLQHLGWPLLCARLGEHLRTPMALAQLGEEIDAGDDGLAAAEAYARTVAGRSADAEAVRRRLAEQDGLAAMLAVQTSLARGEDGRPGFAEALAATSDLREVWPRAGHGLTLSATELLGVLQQLRAAAACVDLLAAVRGERGYAGDPGVAAIAARVERLRPHRELAAALGRSVAPPGPDGEATLLDGASPALARARGRARELRAQLMRAAQRLIKQPGVAEALQDSFYTEREGRVVLPVRADAFSRRGAVAGIIHDSSATGQTLYVEPQALMEENNALREAQLAAAAEERRVLEQLSAQVQAAAGSLPGNQAELVALDAVHARLRLAEAYAGVAPGFVGEADVPEDRSVMTLPAARHPLMLLAGVDVVANDIRLAVGAGLVISGPNAGGKTVALKTLGLCALMAQAGLRLPTRGAASLPLVRRIVTDVGDDQSIAANLSTFSAHMRHVCDALASAELDGPGTLVLLDEVAVGTEPEQGAALAEAILLRLTECGATVVTTTHYERLKLLAMRFPGRFENASVGFDLERLRPTFRLLLGVPGPSSALTVARRLGLPGPVLAHAASLLDDERLQVDALLQQVVAERDALVATRAELERERAALAGRGREVARREAALLQQSKSRKQKAYEAAAAELRALQAELTEERKALRKAQRADPAAAEALAGRLAEARTQLAEQREPAAPVPGKAPPQLSPGERVAVPALGGEGEVVSVKGDRVVVQIGTVRTTVALADVRATKEPERPRAKVRAQAAAPVKQWATSEAARHFGDDAAPIEHGVDNSVDVRGTRAEDALRAVDRMIDEAIRRDREVVLVIHGHGTGALKKAVREHLAALPYVRRQRPGLPPEGGEGVTVAWVGV
jgi:DNA mismatch repair protein MutS2